MYTCFKHGGCISGKSDLGVACWHESNVKIMIIANRELFTYYILPINYADTGLVQYKAVLLAKSERALNAN